MQLPSEIDVAVIGAGSAGVGAGRRLAAAKINFVVLEARDRVGGRAWTKTVDGFPLDLGCGWLHSADHNPWTKIAEEEGLTIDRSPPPWGKPALQYGFSAAEQEEWRAEIAAFYERLNKAAETQRDRPLSDFLEPGGKWNAWLNAISTYVNGVELDRASIGDYAAYEDSGVNWRVAEGYGTAITIAARALPVVFDCAVKTIDHGGRRLRIETARGNLQARTAVITVPSQLIAEEAIRFTPALPEKLEAAGGLPLGLADKAFLHLADAEKFPPDSRLFGRIHPAGAATHQIRWQGRPLIESYFGGKLARELENAGAGALGAFAVDDIVSLVGNDLRPRLRVLATSSWSRDPFARGSYSYALPGFESARAKLAAPVDNRLFFGGEACSPHHFSTAHGGYEAGVTAAEQAIAALAKR
ncbi:MAG TPA: NAD(P)/FAD-dependent oxidoreductase [Xanthobacteraceae bacterium]|nr:NAD(P)/FAD-dependent oxidoreductase [Xanthobacteraceae bacterium]